MYEIRFEKRAADFLEKLERNIQERINKKIDELAENPRIGLPLVGNFAGLWKLRVGEYRIIYQVKNEELIVLVLKIGKRENVYE